MKFSMIWSMNWGQTREQIRAQMGPNDKRQNLDLKTIGLHQKYFRIVSRQWYVLNSIGYVTVTNLYTLQHELCFIGAGTMHPFGNWGVQMLLLKWMRQNCTNPKTMLVEPLGMQVGIVLFTN